MIPCPSPPPKRAITCFSVSVAPWLGAVMPAHWPGAESAVEVNVIGAPEVPTADNDPFTINDRELASPCTVTPGSIVSVTPAATVTFPVITYGLPAAVHVVLLEIVPDTDVDASRNHDNPNGDPAASADHDAGPAHARSELAEDAFASPLAPPTTSPTTQTTTAAQRPSINQTSPRQESTPPCEPRDNRTAIGRCQSAPPDRPTRQQNPCALPQPAMPASASRGEDGSNGRGPPAAAAVSGRDALGGQRPGDFAQGVTGRVLAPDPLDQRVGE